MKADVALIIGYAWAGSLGLVGIAMWMLEPVGSDVLVGLLASALLIGGMGLFAFCLVDK